jgi:hypothetical protein
MPLLALIMGWVQGQKRATPGSLGHARSPIDLGSPLRSSMWTKLIFYRLDQQLSKVLHFESSYHHLETLLRLNNFDRYLIFVLSFFFKGDPDCSIELTNSFPQKSVLYTHVSVLLNLKLIYLKVAELEILILLFPPTPLPFILFYVPSVILSSFLLLILSFLITFSISLFLSSSFC